MIRIIESKQPMSERHNCIILCKFPNEFVNGFDFVNIPYRVDGRHNRANFMVGKWTFKTPIML